MRTTIRRPPSLLPIDSPTIDNLIERLESNDSNSSVPQVGLWTIPETSENNYSDVEIVTKDLAPESLEQGKEERDLEESLRRSSSSHILAPVRQELTVPEPELKSIRYVEEKRDPKDPAPVEKLPLVQQTSHRLKIYGDGPDAHHRIEKSALPTIFADQLALPYTYLYDKGSLTGARIERTIHPLEAAELFKRKKDKNTLESWSRIRGCREIASTEDLKYHTLGSLLHGSLSFLVLSPDEPYILSLEMKKYRLSNRQTKSRPNFFTRLCGRLACCLPGKKVKQQPPRKDG